MIEGDFLGESLVDQRIADHRTGRDFGQRNTDGLADEGNGSRRPRVDFDDVDLVVLDRILNVHQTDDAQSSGELVRVRLELCEVGVADVIGRQDARTVAGMDACAFDMLHYAADDDGSGVGHGVHVEFVGVLQVAVDQDGTLG